MKSNIGNAVSIFETEPFVSLIVSEWLSIRQCISNPNFRGFFFVVMYVVVSTPTFELF